MAMCTDCQDKPHEPTTSNIACLLCRRRKIRCGRELPNCQVCERSGQTCEYPTSILKPGPKIGSMILNRKRKRANGTNDSESSRETRNPGEKTSPKYDNTIDDETSPAAAENPDRARDADNMLPTTHSPSGSEGLKARRDSLNIHDLSFNLHPSHEVSISNKAVSPCSTHVSGSEKSVVITRAANALGLTPDTVENMISIYFENMTAINLFREPYFDQKLQNIESPTVTHALLAAIVAFSSRFCCQEDSESGQYTWAAFGGVGHTRSYFLRLASQLIAQALHECDESPPPLCLLQAAILLAHDQLTQGVRGKAWRFLGTCVRIAYELNLHLVDLGHACENVKVDVEQWCDQEERRRAWWAIWEMDVFASTIRRCPTAIDWSQNETLLPVEDEFWFRGEPRASCFLERDLTRRWSVIQRSGNGSAKAWFIVINSLMKEAQCISSPRSIPNLNLPEDGRKASDTCKRQKMDRAAVEEAAEKLEIISNSVHCFVLALPASLRFRNQYLGFEARLPGQTTSARQQNCGVYNIDAMTQLATLMIHQYDVFGGPVRTGWPKHGTNSRPKSRDHEGSWRASRGTIDADIMALDQYFEAADNILTIVHRSCDKHIQWINPFLASTIWLAAAVQLVRKDFGPSGTNRGLVKSKFDVLYITYQKCVSFWDIQTALQQNLESLEAQLQTFHQENKRPEEARWKRVDRREAREKESWTNESQGRNNERRPIHTSLVTNSSNIDPPWDTLSRRISLNGANQGQILQTLSYTDSASTTANAVHPFHQQQPSVQSPQTEQIRQRQEIQQQPSAIHAEPISPAGSTLGFMQLPVQADKTTVLGTICTDTAYMYPELFTSISQQDCPINIEESDKWLHVMGGDLGLSSYINELLLGGYKY